MPRKRVRKLVSYSTSEDSSYSSSDSGYSTPRPSAVSVITPDVRETKKRKNSKTLPSKKLKFSKPLMSVYDFHVGLLTPPPVVINSFTEALNSGNLLRVKKLLLEDPAVWRDESTLMFICMHEKVDSILNLIAAMTRERPRLHTSSPYTPLHALCMNKHMSRLESLQFILSLNTEWISTRIEEFGNIVPIHLLVLSENLNISDEELVKAFKLLNPSFSLVAFSENWTCLQLCASCRVLKALIMADCDPYCIDKNTGQSFLHSLCLQGKSEMVKIFVENVPDDDVFAYTDRSGASALHVAAAGSLQSHAECIGLVASRIRPERLGAVLKDKRGWPPLMYALCSKSSETVLACIEMDRVGRDATWGQYPQLTACMHLVEAQANRIKKLNASNEENQLITIFTFITRVPGCTDAINEFLGGKLGRTWNDSLEVFFDSQSLCPVSIENKLHYIHERALRHTRELGVKSTIFIDVDDPVSQIVPQYVQGQLLEVRGGCIRNYLKSACKNLTVSFDSGMLAGLVILDRESIGLVRIDRDIVCSIFHDDQMRRGFFTVVHPEWMKLTVTELESIFCN